MGWHRNGHGNGHGHGARAKAQVQFTAKRLRSFTHIAAQSHAVAMRENAWLSVESGMFECRRRERSHPTEKPRERR